MIPDDGTMVRAKLYNFDGRHDVPGAVYAPDGPDEPLGDELGILGTLTTSHVDTPFGAYTQYWVTTPTGKSRQVEPDTITPMKVG
jgi:hypothetical protein